MPIAAGADEFAFEITAVDKASGILSKFNLSVKNLGKPVEELNKKIKKTDGQSGFSEFRKSVQKLKKESKEVGDALASVAPPLAVLTGAASIGGLVALASRFSSMGASLGRASVAAKVSVYDLYSLRGAADQAGSSAESMGKGIQSLADNLVDGAAGRAPDFINMLNTIGISSKGEHGLKTVTDILPEIAEKLSHISDPTRRARVEMALLGAAGAELDPLMKSGAEGLAQYRREADLHGKMDQEGADLARKYEIANVNLRQSVSNLGNTIGGVLAPNLIPLLDNTAKWVDTHGPDVAHFFDGMATSIANAGFEFGFALPKMEDYFDKLQARIAATKIVPSTFSNLDNDDVFGRWLDSTFPSIGHADQWLSSHTGGLLGMSPAQQAGTDRRAAVDPATVPESPYRQRQQAMAALANGQLPAGSGTLSAAEDAAASHLNEGPSQANAFLRANGNTLDAARNAWCAAFVGSALHSVGIKGSGSDVATSYLGWGKSARAEDTQKGDVLVQARGHAQGETGGHVGMATGQTRVNPRTGALELQMLSGNYGDKVSTSWEAASSLNVRHMDAAAPLPVPGQPPAPGMAPPPGAPPVPGGQVGDALNSLLTKMNSNVPTGAPNGSVDININHNAPAGVSLSSRVSGQGINPPTVSRAMAGAG